MQRERGKIGMWAGLWLFALACSVNLPKDGKYSCAAEADCDGEGYTCVGGLCCKAQSEQCNGLDDDCDGTVDDDVAPLECYPGPAGTAGVGLCKAGSQACSGGAFGECAGSVVPRAETCDGKDEDCDGTADDGIDTQTDDKHCGGCGKPCQFFEKCSAGACAPVGESSCLDGADNDGDMLIDCLDPHCDRRSCGAGCTCLALAKVESGCGDGQDNEGDGRTDCLDGDCLGKACEADGGAGCACIADGGMAETRCFDAVDGDRDGKTDCVDPDCLNGYCQSPPKLFRCNLSMSCVCPQLDGGAPVSPAAEATDGLCFNGFDDDCSGAADCADAQCAAASCGAGCGCRSAKKSELLCADLSDNDGDQLTDCADVADCSAGTACQKSGGAAGTCQGQACQ